MEVKYKDHMGDDLSVANAARVSFGKQTKAIEIYPTTIDEQLVTIPFTNVKDRHLIEYLAKHDHWTPFAHTSITFYIKSPIFIARQLGKHQVGLVWNEISRRYVSSEPEFYLPQEWRLAAEDKKQGSLDETIKYDDAIQVQEIALQHYQSMLEKGIAPEQARMVLPQSTYTEWYWTGSLYAFARICKLRLQPDAQKETRYIAQLISDRCDQLFPISWAVLL